jgi:SET domain-containing protein|tara:strand:- start:453 stop:800 length:348 start_codon:yes stop_codon:yes gene_type:complete
MKSKLIEEYSAKGEISKLVYQDDSPIHGLGLFAKEDIANRTFIHDTHIWSNMANSYINLKPNCMYNHSTKPNCKVSKTGNRIRLESITSIKKGDELLVNYNQNPDIELPQEDWID